MEVLIKASKLHFEGRYANFPLQDNPKVAPISADFTGETFSAVLNTSATALERLLVEQNVMGPCWLKVANVGTLAGLSAK